MREPLSKKTGAAKSDRGFMAPPVFEVLTADGRGWTRIDPTECHCEEAQRADAAIHLDGDVANTDGLPRRPASSSQ
jgi:hypothetical protein